MKSIEFKEVNQIHGGDGYKSLYTYTDKGNDGIVVACYKLSVLERLRLLLKGKLWVSVLTFNHPLQPQYITTKKVDIFPKQDKDPCNCEVHKKKGCAHVDGILCDYPNCEILKNHNYEQ